MTTTLTRHDLFPKEELKKFVCEDHTTDGENFIFLEWDKDRECWYCPECAQRDFEEDYRQTEPL